MGKWKIDYEEAVKVERNKENVNIDLKLKEFNERFKELKSKIKNLELEKSSFYVDGYINGISKTFKEKMDNLEEDISESEDGKLKQLKIQQRINLIEKRFKTIEDGIKQKKNGENKNNQKEVESTTKQFKILNNLDNFSISSDADQSIDQSVDSLALEGYDYFEEIKEVVQPTGTTNKGLTEKFNDTINKFEEKKLNSIQRTFPKNNNQGSAFNDQRDNNLTKRHQGKNNGLVKIVKNLNIPKILKQKEDQDDFTEKAIQPTSMTTQCLEGRKGENNFKIRKSKKNTYQQQEQNLSNSSCKNEDNSIISEHSNSSLKKNTYTNKIQKENTKFSQPLDPDRSFISL